MLLHLQTPLWKLLCPLDLNFQPPLLCPFCGGLCGMCEFELCTRPPSFTALFTLGAALLDDALDTVLLEEGSNQ